MDFSRTDFIFVRPSISHFSPSPLLLSTALSGNSWSILGQKKRDFDKNCTSIVINCEKKLVHYCCISVPIKCISFQWLVLLKCLPNCGIVVACFVWNSTLSPFTTWFLFFSNNLARFYSVDTALWLVEHLVVHPYTTRWHECQCERLPTLQVKFSFSLWTVHWVKVCASGYQKLEMVLRQR